MISSCAAIIGNEVIERSLEQKEIKRVAFEHCKKRILLIDHSKFTAHGTYRLSDLRDYDLIATDTQPPYEIEVGNAKFVY